MNRIERMAQFARAGLQGRRGRIGLAAAGACALLLVGFAAAPAGAKTEFVIGGGGVSMEIKPAVTIKAPVTIKAGPVTFTGNAAPMRAPSYVSNVGHFVVNGYGGAQRPLAVPVGGLVYICPPFAAPTRNLYGYAGTPVYGAAGYGVPRYDYRAAGSTRARSAYFQALEMNRRAQARAPRPEIPGTFNQPATYRAVPDTTLRPIFAPLIVQIAGQAQAGGKLPLVHKPAGKSFIRVE